MPKFPHVGNDAFPHLENVKPFERKVPFDYGRYDYTATLKLCSVPWPADYRHVINWQSASERDAWFDALDGKTVDLANGFTRTQTDTVRVPVPYDVALMYNYVYMRVPQLTEDDAIDYEDAPGVRVICAHIQDAIYYAPSTTELVLGIDYWTTYLPHLVANITLMLHRGHAPAYAVDAEAYLASPRANSAYLLTPDITFGTPDVCAHAELVDIAQGEKYLVMASTIPYSSIESLTLASVQSGSSTAASFYDTGARNGHQVGVSGYEWHYGAHGYDNMENPSSYSGVGRGMPTYTRLYAIPTANASNVLTTLASRLPQFIKSVQAAYILPASMLTLASESFTVAGVTLYRVVPSPALTTIADLELSKAQFGYPSRYADIAKLYTFPYAHLIVSDTLGHEIVVRIEDMGADASMVAQVSPMVECLRWDILLTDVNSAGPTNYVWQDLDGTANSLTLPGADVARYTLELGIPTYALYLDGRTTHAADTYYDEQSQRASAINSYQATMRGANTAKENADDSADTAKTNADASANTNVTNTANSGRTSQANATIANNLRTTSTARNNQAQNSSKNDAVQNIYDSSNADLEYTEFASDANLKSEAVSAIQNLVGNAVMGNVAGVLNTGVSGIVNITTSAALSGYSMQNVLDHQAISQGHTRTQNNIQVSNATAQAGYANTANTNTTNNNVSVANTNASNSANTAKANATRSQSTAKANAGYSRDTTEENAKAALELARQNYVRQGHMHDLDNPSAFGLASGDRTADALMRRVVQLRIETQSASAIARAGDAMLRYGYTFDGLWNVTDWCPEGHAGCYWEASEVLVPADELDNPTAERAFESILASGVTVWNDPAKIGGIPWQ